MVGENELAGYHLKSNLSVPVLVPQKKANEDTININSLPEDKSMSKPQ